MKKADFYMSGKNPDGYDAFLSPFNITLQVRESGFFPVRKKSNFYLTNIIFLLSKIPVRQLVHENKTLFNRASQNKRKSAIPSNSSGGQEALEGESQGKRKCTKSSIIYK